MVLNGPVFKACETKSYYSDLRPDSHTHAEEYVYSILKYIGVTVAKTYLLCNWKTWMSHWVSENY